MDKQGKLLSVAAMVAIVVILFGSWVCEFNQAPPFEPSFELTKGSFVLNEFQDFDTGETYHVYFIIEDMYGDNADILYINDLGGISGESMEVSVKDLKRSMSMDVRGWTLSAEGVMLELPDGSQYMVDEYQSKEGETAFMYGEYCLSYVTNHFSTTIAANNCVNMSIDYEPCKIGEIEYGDTINTFSATYSDKDYVICNTTYTWKDGKELVEVELTDLATGEVGKSSLEVDCTMDEFIRHIMMPDDLSGFTITGAVMYYLPLTDNVFASISAVSSEGETISFDVFTGILLDDKDVYEDFTDFWMFSGASFLE